MPWWQKSSSAPGFIKHAEATTAVRANIAPFLSLPFQLSPFLCFPSFNLSWLYYLSPHVHPSWHPHYLVSVGRYCFFHTKLKTLVCLKNFFFLDSFCIVGREVSGRKRGKRDVYDMQQRSLAYPSHSHCPCLFLPLSLSSLLSVPIFMPKYLSLSLCFIQSIDSNPGGLECGVV